MIDELTAYVKRIYPRNVCKTKASEDRLAIQFYLSGCAGVPLAIVFNESEIKMYRLGNEIHELLVTPSDGGLTPIKNELSRCYMDSMIEIRKELKK